MASRSNPFLKNANDLLGRSRALIETAHVYQAQLHRQIERATVLLDASRRLLEVSAEVPHAPAGLGRGSPSRTPAKEGAERLTRPDPTSPQAYTQPNPTCRAGVTEHPKLGGPARA